MEATKTMMMAKALAKRANRVERNTSYQHQVTIRFLSDLINNEIVGASDGCRYGVSWLANYATDLRDSYGLEIKSIPKGKGLKHYYLLVDKEHAVKVLKLLQKKRAKNSYLSF